jgi:glycogen debranching enzyme
VLYKSALDELATEHPHVYKAAIPGYTSNFSRDSFTYGLLADDLDALEAQVEFSARLQGRQPDPRTGEEPGKIHHEHPGLILRELDTTYNACDTTALFLIAIAHLAENGRPEVVTRYRSNIDRALEYIVSHLENGVFYEDTRQSGAERFALTVTYWKDSELNAERKEPEYPIGYSLVHFKNKEAVGRMVLLLDNSELIDLATFMTERGFQTFWSDDHFIIADEPSSGRRIDHPSSDSLHILLYIEPEEIDPAYAHKIVDYSEQLASRSGYLPAVQQVAELDPYHASFVWVHEQALLHMAARKHRLHRAEEITMRILPVLEMGFPELVDPHQDTVQAHGNPTQLWSIGAHLYFERLQVEMTLARQLAVTRSLRPRRPLHLVKRGK